MLALAALLFALTLSRSAFALQVEAADADDPEAENAPLRLIDQPPWDRLRLNAANGNAELKLVPVTPRVVPKNPRPNDKLRIRLLENPSQEYDVEWQYIVELRLFEQMLLDEAAALTAAGDSNEAWHYLEFLAKNHPRLEGLEQVRQDYLYAEAGRLYQQQRYDAALGVLEELHRLNQAYSGGGSRPLADVLSAVVDKLAGGFVDEGNYLAARRLLDRIELKFGEKQQAAVAKWRQAMIGLAEVKRDEALRLVDDEKLLEARAASREVLEIWPKLPGAQQLAAEIAAKFPVIIVGVSQRETQGDPTSFDNWGARRIGRLTRRMLVEFDGHRPDGGQYSTPLGSLRLSDDRRRITFELSGSGSGTRENSAVPSPRSGIRENSPGASPPSGFELSRRLLSLADRSNPTHNPLWAHLLDSVQVDDVQNVRVNLSHPHVLPQALLQLPLAEPSVGDSATGNPSAVPSQDGPYVVASRSAESVRFSPNPRLEQVAGRHDVFEQHYADVRQAAKALSRGEIDVVDRLLPADAVRLRSEPSIVVEPYALPTMHLLLANPNNPFTASATFRRGLVYGIDRENILRRTLLEGGAIEGCRVVSGPFPPGISDNDSWAYAYDPQVEPRPYEPRLALSLVELSRHETAEFAKRRSLPEPKLQPLTLAHPADGMARVICESIAEQLALVGVDCRLKPLPPGQTADPTGKWDLLFVEAAVWEPFVDARRLLSLPGVAELRGDYVRTAQMRLDVAQNEAEGRRRLRELHQLVHHEATVIPLWQMVNHLAYRRSIVGIGQRPLHLYQDVPNWRRAAEPAVALK